MTTIEWLVDQVEFLTKRVYALEKELKEIGRPAPFDNLEAMRNALKFGNGYVDGKTDHKST